MTEPVTLSTLLCPQCGGKTSFGYGLAFGGMGPYLICLDCNHYVKWFDETEEPLTDTTGCDI